MTRRFFYETFIKRVIDGDSLEVVVDLGLNVNYTTDVRFNGIDAPESFRPSSDLEKQAGELVKSYVRGLIEGKNVFIKTYKNSKYGDYLADIYLDENDEFSLNELMLKEGYARPYIGDKKVPWTEEELNHIINKLS